MGRGVGDIFQLLVWLFPPWAIALIAALTLLAALPGLRYGQRTRRIKSSIRQMVRADPARRSEMFERTLATAAEDGHLLALVAREARKRSLPDLYQRALEQLDAHPTLAHQADVVRGETRRPKTHKRHPLEAAIAVENLIEEGLTTRAREQLEDALQDHPRDAALLELAARLDAPSTEPL